MPKIVKTDSQEAALKNIQDALKTVTSLNNLLPESGLKDCKIRVTGMAEGKNINEIFYIPYQLIQVSLRDYRKRLIAEINQKSRTYSIVLDETDTAIINPEKMKKNESETSESTNN